MAWKKLGLGLRKHHASSTTKSTLDGDGGCGSVHLCVAVRPCVLLLWADESQRARADRYVIRYTLLDATFVALFLDAASKFNSHWAPKNASFQWPIPNCSRVSTVRVRVQTDHSTPNRTQSRQSSDVQSSCRLSSWSARSVLSISAAIERLEWLVGPTSRVHGGTRYTRRSRPGAPRETGCRRR